jgi:hypothetical protein
LLSVPGVENHVEWNLKFPVAVLGYEIRPFWCFISGQMTMERQFHFLWEPAWFIEKPTMICCEAQPVSCLIMPLLKTSEVVRKYKEADVSLYGYP